MVACFFSSGARHIWWGEQLGRWSRHSGQCGRHCWTSWISARGRQRLVGPRLCRSCCYTGSRCLWVMLRMPTAAVRVWMCRPNYIPDLLRFSSRYCSGLLE